MAVLTRALARLRADVNTRFPNRDKASDGWIGDKAHQQTISGHNPDESGGGEYEDADSKDEVRAIDVDVTFREPGVTAQQLVDSILRTPADLARLRYIIHNRRIWSRNTGWEPRGYDGSNPHTEHIHFSGDPSTDESDAPFYGVLNVERGAFMAELSEAEQRELLGRVRVLDGRGHAAAYGLDKVPADFGFGAVGTPVWSVTQAKSLQAAVAALAADDQGRARQILAAIGQVDEEVLAGVGGMDADAAAEALLALMGETRALALANALSRRIPLPPTN
jgi:hypothetical protein